MGSDWNFSKRLEREALLLERGFWHHAADAFRI